METNVNTGTFAGILHAVEMLGKDADGVVRLTFTFGRNIGSGAPERARARGPVTDGEVDTFLASVARNVPGFSIRHGVGFWNGERESSFDVVVVLDFGAVKEADSIVNSLAFHVDTYKRAFGQDAVLVTVEPVAVRLV